MTLPLANGPHWIEPDYLEDIIENKTSFASQLEQTAH
jgi:hypothetical protein